jgi:hypothetical protein
MSTAPLIIIAAAVVVAIWAAYTVYESRRKGAAYDSARAANRAKLDELAKKELELLDKLAVLDEKNHKPATTYAPHVSRSVEAQMKAFEDIDQIVKGWAGSGRMVIIAPEDTIARRNQLREQLGKPQLKSFPASWALKNT